MKLRNYCNILKNLKLTDKKLTTKPKQTPPHSGLYFEGKRDPVEKLNTSINYVYPEINGFSPHTSRGCVGTGAYRYLLRYSY